MLNFEIKHFRMDIGDLHGLTCTTPCSLPSVLCEHSLVTDAYFENNVDLLREYASKGCVATADFSVDTLVYSMANILLSLPHIEGLRRVELNGTELAYECSASSTAEVKSVVRMGTNTLKLYMDKADSALESFAISDGVRIIAFAYDILDTVLVTQNITDSGVEINISAKALRSLDSARAVATLVSPGGEVHYCGMMQGEGSITVREPNMWWPNRLGVQNLYKLTVNLYVGAEIEDTREMRIGLRSFSVHKNEDADTSRLMVNGVGYLPMGAEYGREDLIPSRITRQRTERLICECSKAGVNTVLTDRRYPPTEALFDCADKYGIVVLYRVCADDFTDDGTGRVKNLCHKIANLANHASFAALLVDREVRERIDGLREDIAIIVEECDGMTYTDDSVRMRIDKLGIRSLPSSGTLAKYIEEDNLNLFSETLESRWGRDVSLELVYNASQLYRYSSDIDSLCYMTQLTQADREQRHISALRSARDKSEGAFVGALTEPMPTVFCSMLDYSGAHKAMYYFAKRFFAPTRIFATHDGTRVTFNISNEQKLEYNGRFSYSVNDASNRTVFKDSFPIGVDPFTSADILTIDLGEIVAGHEREYYVSYSISDGMITTSKGTLLFTYPKYFKFKKPTIRTDIQGSGAHYSIVVSSDVFASGVYIGFKGFNSYVEDNFFDITDSSAIRLEIELDSAEAIETLRRELTVRSVYDIGR